MIVFLILSVCVMVKGQQPSVPSNPVVVASPAAPAPSPVQGICFAFILYLDFHLKSYKVLFSSSNPESSKPNTSKWRCWINFSFRTSVSSAAKCCSEPTKSGASSRIALFATTTTCHGVTPGYKPRSGSSTKFLSGHSSQRDTFGCEHKV